MANVDNGDDEPLVFVISGKVRRAEPEDKIPFNAVLCAADDDAAVRICLEVLAGQGYEEADLDQIGNIIEPPAEGELADAYEVALEGGIGLVVYGGSPDGMQPPR